MGKADNFLPYELTPRDERIAAVLVYLFRRATEVFFSQLLVYRSGEHSDESYLVKKPGLDSELPTLLIANHPNGIIDAVVIYVTAGQTLRVVAKSTLWNEPILRPFLKFAGAVPILRVQDQEEIAKGLHESAMKVTTNQEAMGLVARALCKHSCVIFPEGRSHEDPAMSQFKTGGTRMLLSAATLFEREHGKKDTKLKVASKLRSALDFGFQPVGLYFEDKTRFRSRAVVHYGRRVALRDIISEDDVAKLRDNPMDNDVVHKITDAMAKSLRELLPEAPDRQTLQLIRRIAALLVGKQRKVRVADVYNWEIAVKRVVSTLTSGASERYGDLILQVQNYFQKLETLDVPDTMVRYLARSKDFPWSAIIQRGLWYWGMSLLASPLIILGIVAYWPMLALTGIVARKLAIDGTEEATYKFIAGVLFSSVFTALYSALIAWVLSGTVNVIVVVLAAILLPPTAAAAALIFREKRDYYMRELKAVLSRRYRSQLRTLVAEREALVENVLQCYEEIA